MVVVTEATLVLRPCLELPGWRREDFPPFGPASGSLSLSARLSLQGPLLWLDSVGLGGADEEDALGEPGWAVRKDGSDGERTCVGSGAWTLESSVVTMVGKTGLLAMMPADIVGLRKATIREL